MTCTGITLRSALDDFVAARGMLVCRGSQEGEVTGIHEALSRIKLCGLEQLEVISNCKTALNAIHSRAID